MPTDAKRKLRAGAIGAVVLGALAVSGPVLAADEAIGLALEGYAYPYPVQAHAVRENRRDLTMSYMDAAPTTPANGRTIVLLHGKNFMGAYWRDTFPVLAAAGFRVVVPDQIGFGKSAKPGIAYSFHALAGHTASLLDALAVERAVVLGHSMGGMLAARFTLKFPDRVDALVLENPIGLEDYQRVVPVQTIDEATKAITGWARDSIIQQHKNYYAAWEPRYAEWAEPTICQT